MSNNIDNIDDYESYISSLSIEQLVDIAENIDISEHRDKYELVLDYISRKKKDLNIIAHCPRCANVNTDEIQYCKKCGLDLRHYPDSDPLETEIPVIPIFNSIYLVLHVIWEKRYRLFQALIVVTTVMVLINTIVTISSRLSEFSPYELLTFLNSILFILFAINCHRIILIGDKSVPSYGLYRWGMRETRFLGWVFLIGFIAFIATMTISLITGIFLSIFNLPSREMLPYIIFVATIPGAYIFARYSLLLPATAIDKRPRMSAAWYLSAENDWRLFLLVGLPPIAVGQVSGYLLTNLESLIGIILLNIAIYILSIVEIALLSLSYKTLIDKAQEFLVKDFI